MLEGVLKTGGALGTPCELERDVEVPIEDSI